MKKSLLLFTVVLSLLLAACAGSTPDPTPVPEPTATAAVDPTATAEPAAAPDGPTLTTQPWQWTGFSGATERFQVETPERYVLTFNPDGTVNIVADCNNAMGDYTDDDGAITITVGPMTKAMCPPDSRSDQFVTFLGAAARYFFADGALFIDLMADGGTLRLDPAEATTEVASEADAAVAEQLAAQMAAISALLVENPWKWTNFSSADEEVAIETPASYQLTFQADGTVAIQADCNNASGSYTFDGINFSVEVGPATLMACPGDSRGEQFLQLLGEAVQLFPLDGKLFVILSTEGSSMILEPVLTTVVDLCGDAALTINTLEDTLSPELSASLDQILTALVTAAPRPGPGASMLIITPQGRYFKSTGVSDVSTCEPVTVDSPYQIGSNTKMMTAAILFQLQEEGVLSTTDLLRDWLPELAAQLPYGDKITLDMMMTHTSGLYDYFDAPTADGASIASGEADKAMLTRGFTPEELVTIVADSGLSSFEPAAEGKWHYSNTGYILLGLIIEKATGKTYAENLQERIFEPLGLEQTYLQTGQPEAGALPQAYFKTPYDFTTSEWNASQGWSAGAVVSTPAEFAIFLKALFTGALFSEAATLDLMQQHAPAGVDALGPGALYAHGMLNNNGVLGHGGQTLGFQSEGGYIPGADVTIVLWSNAAESNVSRAVVPLIANTIAEAGQAAQSTLPRFEPLDECFALPAADLNADLDVECGYVVVPQSRSSEGSGEVKLGITRIKADQGSANAPLFMLSGGPGQTNVSALSFSFFQTELLGGILAERDIVLVEQRGTQYSVPFLNCPDSLTATWDAHERGLTGADADEFALGLLNDCIEGFKAQGVDFNAYNSGENAADINDVRAALGYDKIIYYGASYGSQLGQHVMRDFPEILEAVVLDGAEALSRKSWVENRALDAQWGIDNLTRLCQADAKCAQTYDIPALVDAALALFDNGPLPYTYTDPSDPSVTIDVEVTVHDIVSFIYGQQGDRLGAMSLPATLLQLTEGGAEMVAELFGGMKGGSVIASRTAATPAMSMLMHIAMVCSDDPVKSVDEVKLDGAGRYATLFGQAGGEQYTQFCALIGVDELPDTTDVDVTLDVPTLLLSGGLDVATPTFRSQEVADALPNATLVIFPDRTHVQIAGVNICAAQIMTQFVLDPTATLDTSCVDETPQLGFILPDGSSSRD